ncbi:hypothetical protein [Entomohabitans teleogrylli]|uniref:hypothetical protein n=1 Tax=Entomohabitans teleogrylli TaxID=1384589 RepID=UPI0012B69947|nr:hypothetical protein [Entomohabitans teleogrylli]
MDNKNNTAEAKTELKIPQGAIKRGRHLFVQNSARAEKLSVHFQPGEIMMTMGYFRYSTGLFRQTGREIVLKGLFPAIPLFTVTP